MKKIFVFASLFVSVLSFGQTFSTSEEYTQEINRLKARREVLYNYIQHPIDSVSKLDNYKELLYDDCVAGSVNDAPHKLYSLLHKYDKYDSHHQFGWVPEGFDNEENIKAIFNDKTLIVQTVESSAIYKKLNSVLGNFNYKISRRDSAGGIGFLYSCFNNSNKVIKYLYFNVSFKNRVGDYVTDDITNKRIVNLREVGPIGPNETIDYGGWLNAIYSWEAAKILINKITIQYTDGSVYTIVLSTIDNDNFDKYYDAKEAITYCNQILAKKHQESLREIKERVKKSCSEERIVINEQIIKLMQEQKALTRN